MDCGLPKLTKRLIDLATHPAKGQRFLRDGELRGFAIRITKGSKTFILEREIQGRVRRMTLGRYGMLTIDQARDLANVKIVEIAKGNDPGEEKERRSQSATFVELETRYLAQHAVTKANPPLNGALMNKIEEHTNRSLGALMDSRQLSEFTTVSVERIEELVQLLLIPHLRVDNGPPLFRKREAAKWINDNLVTEYAGATLPIRFAVHSLVAPDKDIPIELSSMRDRLFEGLGQTGFNPPCIYFLISNRCIAYVGQSINLPSRLDEHRRSGKSWERVLWIPCPEAHLQDVEQFWIRHIKPPLNNPHEVKGYEINPPTHLVFTGVQTSAER